MADTTKIKRVQKVNIIGPDGSKKNANVYLAPDADKVLVNPTDGSGNKASLQDFLLAKYTVLETNKKDADGNDIYDANGDPIKEVVKDANGKPIIIRATKEDGTIDYYPIDPSKTSFYQEWNDYQECLKRRLVGIYDENGNYTGYDFLIVNGDKQDPVTQANLAEIAKRYDGYTVNIGGENVTILGEDLAEQLLMDLEKKSIYQHLIDLESFWVELPIENYEEANTFSIASKQEIAALSLLNNDWSEQNEPT